jgi:cytoskeletal protein CcmA (bactofilin family)
MFANRKKRPSIEMTKLSSLIAEDVEIIGDVSFAGGIRIDGRVVGNVTARAAEGESRGLLVVSDKGRIEGSVRCGDAVVNGAVVGSLEIENFLELQSNANVSGTIRYRHLRMDVGAVVQGQLLQAEATPASDNVVALEMKSVSAP